MAIAGGATTAYFCSLNNGQLVIIRTSCLSALCLSPKDAVTAMMDGKRATVAGPDMVALRKELEEKESDK